MGQIALELVLLPFRVWGVKPPELTIKDMMLEFGTAEEIEERSGQADAERRKAYSDQLRGGFMAMFDIDPATGKARNFKVQLPPGMTRPGAEKPQFAPPPKPKETTASATPADTPTPVKARKRVWTSNGSSSG